MVGALVALCACGDGTSDQNPGDGPGKPGPTTEFAGCDYTDLAGDWAGTVDEMGYTYAFELSVEPVTDLDAVFATGAYPGAEPGTVDCATEYPCLARTQNDWIVTTERLLSGQCLDGLYTLLRLESDDTLSVVWQHAEYTGMEAATATLNRVP